MPIGKESEIADAHEAAGEQVQEETTQELIDEQSHQPRLVAVSEVSPTKGYVVLGKSGTCQESCVGENHAAVSKRDWNMVLSWGKAVEIELERLGLRQRPCSREETTRPSFNFKLSSD